MIDIFEQQITQDIWKDKYRYLDEASPDATLRRVCGGVYEKDPEHKAEGVAATAGGLWLPGGRVIAGAGTSKVVTLMNCYVVNELIDSMQGIADTLRYSMLTMQQGGGIGINFSKLRPEGGELKRTGFGSMASGPLPFMDTWDAMCKTIISAGARRGAMMAVISDTHPDLPKFIVAKQKEGRLTKFNVSVLISNAFMEAVRHNEPWDLHFKVPPVDRESLGTFVDDAGVTQYIYSKWQARDLWEMIINGTFEFAEPGVIFIDRINEMNNLEYCEYIECTNPCGEQPLPYNGTCNLGAVNLANCVNNPFTDDAKISWSRIIDTVQVGVRFLDNVIDVTRYPMEEQREEEFAKRRIGLGITGLADMLIQLGQRYGSSEAENTTRRTMREIAYAAYSASVDLAKERGPFPLFDRNKFIDQPFIKKLDPEIQDDIAEFGIRNGVLLTIAPVGTGSIFFGNISSGMEPVFSHKHTRKVLQQDGSHISYDCESYSYRRFREKFGPDRELPNYMATAEALTVDEHVRMQAACQEWVDASISKTINCPVDITLEQFTKVYDLAFDLGCKGCTTYKPNPIRGSVLDATTGKEVEVGPKVRPRVLHGTTYKIHWPSLTSAMYITINEDDGKPYEVFFGSKSGKYSEWTTALSLMISAIMRISPNASFISDELKQVVSAHDSAWIDGKYYGSLVAMIGDVIEEHFASKDISVLELPFTTDQATAQRIVKKHIEGARADHGKGGPINRAVPQDADASLITSTIKGEICTSCGAPAMIHTEGCSTCMACGFSNCG